MLLSQVGTTTPADASQSFEDSLFDSVGEPLELIASTMEARLPIQDATVFMLP